MYNIQDALNNLIFKECGELVSKKPRNEMKKWNEFQLNFTKKTIFFLIKI